MSYSVSIFVAKVSILEQHLQMGHTGPKPGYQNPHQNEYRINEEDIYSDKSGDTRRASMPLNRVQVADYTMHSNKRTLHTNCSNLVTGASASN